jgi:Ca2+/H+ antiporter, TMEM165/GDT1 family
VASFLSALAIGAIAELGDKSQFLLFILSFRIRRRLALVLGMLVATLLTHALAGLGAAWVSHAVSPDVLHWSLALLFLALSAWAFFPRLTDNLGVVMTGGAFLTAAVTFSVVEIGDKSNVAAAALAAQTEGMLPIILGTALGTVLVNLPVGIYGPRLAEILVARNIALSRISRPAALLFGAIGIAMLFGFGPS